ncbi:hypothetical protein TW65_71803 [Stemphylium lycopersici]|nr:hypothetical protein TW65_71803 [Stemphylium lycopersici]
MEVSGYDALVYYATPPNSYIGTTVFLSYIIAALYATITIVWSLHSQYANIFHASGLEKDERLYASKTARARHIKIYAFLASISFAALSYNMLMFLITHYYEWSGGKRGIQSNANADKMLRWMLDSTLFYDFAQDLVKNPPNTIWTQAAILATWFWNIYMGQKARERKYDASMMRTYILLSQILPISFTVSLFLIQLHLSSPDIMPKAAAETLTKPDPAPKRRKPIASLQIPNILLNAALLALPALRTDSTFMVILSVARAVLLLPQSQLMSLRDADVVKCITVSGGFAVANAAMLIKDLTLNGLLGAIGDGGYAVKALGWDAILGFIVYIVLGWGGGV